MSIAIHTNASNMNALEMWQSAVAHNLANSSVPGFQKTMFSVEGAEMAGRSSKVPSAFSLEGKLERSLTPGAVKVTANPMDFAIHGDGYFAVQGPNGNRLYTRNGEFHLDPEGTLVNTQGFPVEGEGGPITVDTKLGQVSVAIDGTVSQQGQEIAKLGIYRFNNTDALKTYQGVLMADPDGAARPVAMENATVYQGQLEMSNVSPVQEMISMIEIARAYELSQKVIQQNDERQEKTIQTFSS